MKTIKQPVQTFWAIQPAAENGGPEKQVSSEYKQWAFDSPFEPSAENGGSC
jgi:hypothetical protein